MEDERKDLAAENVEVESLSDDDLETVAGGADSNVYSACCSVVANACCDATELEKLS